MAHFIVLAHHEQDITDYLNTFPEHDFTFLSFANIGHDVRQINAVTQDRIADSLRDAHARHPFAGVLFGSNPEIYVMLAAELTRHIDLKRMIKDPRVARDKFLMKSTLAGHVKCPKSWLIKSEVDVAALELSRWPCVLKPRYGYGSLGVVVVDNKRHLVREYAKMVSGLEGLDEINSTALVNRDFVVEQFIPGSEHTVETLIRDSEVVMQIVSDKMEMNPPYFIEVGDVMPSKLRADTQKRLCDTAQTAIRVLGIENGWTHTELKCFKDEIYVMEVAARNGGGYTVDVVDEAYNFSIRRALIDLYLGQPIDVPAPPVKTVIARRLVVNGITLVWNVDGISHCESKGLLSVKSQRISDGSTGLFIGPPYSYDNTVLSYFIAKESLAEAEQAFDEVERTIQIKSVAFLRKPNVLFKLYCLALRQVSRSEPLRQFFRKCVGLQR